MRRGAPTPEALLTKKTCTKCGHEKNGSEFYPSKRTKDGLRWTCKQCSKDETKYWADSNKDHIREYHKKLRSTDKYRSNFNRYSKEWREKNREKAKAIWDRHNSLKYSTIKGKLDDSIRARMNMSLAKGSKGGRRWEDLVGFTVERLKSHIEKQFLPGMTWENHGEWHIDHKIPVVAFNYTKPEDLDFKRCWALNNLGPMWADKNISKGGRVDRPFQPSLSISL